MAILSSTSPLQGAKGLVGGLMFRTVDGKTVVSAYNKPDKRKMKRRETELQRLYRLRFAEASRYAKEVLCDIDTYEYYKRKAKKLGVGSAYAAVITDFLRKGRIEKIDASRLEKKGEVVVKAVKKDLEFTNVKLRVVARDGEVLREVKGVREGNGMWRFKYTGERPRLGDVRLCVEAEDRVGHVVSEYCEAA